MTAPIRTIIADDHKLVRAGIVALLNGIEGVQVVAQAGDGHEALEAVSRERPDIALLDIAMPLLNGIEATQRITREYPNTRVLVLSTYVNEEYVIQALHAGAAGYLVKGADTPELDLALKALMRGESYLSPAISKPLITEYAKRVGGEAGSLELLTPRQREILQMLVEGLSAGEIARRLKLSRKTVETHRAVMMDRLDIHDLPGLIRYAMRVGMVPAEEGKSPVAN
jgi:DNA-binding NarL/FixJ family response regulator